MLRGRFCCRPDCRIAGPTVADGRRIAFSSLARLVDKASVPTIVSHHPFGKQTDVRLPNG